MNVETDSSYLDPEVLSRIKGLDLQARLIVEGYVSGMHRSPYHGVSVEFAEHREYVPGDDLRHVDWKVWGRSDKYYLKQYEEETNLLVHMALDTSESMRYRSTQVSMSKLQYAECVVASLAYLTLQQQDSVGLTTFDEEIRKHVRASSNASHLNQLLHALEQSIPEQKSTIGPILHTLAERLAHRELVIILSDLFDNPASLISGMQHLRHRKHDVIVFHVLDPAEIEFPFQEHTLFQGMEGHPDLLANPATLRAAYQTELDQFLKEVRKGCQLNKIDYVLLRTDQPLDVALTGYLTRRQLQK